MTKSIYHTTTSWLKKIQDRRQIKTQTIHKQNTTPKKHTKQNTAKQNYPGLVSFYHTWPGNEVRLFYNATERGNYNYSADNSTHRLSEFPLHWRWRSRRVWAVVKLSVQFPRVQIIHKLSHQTWLAVSATTKHSLQLSTVLTSGHSDTQG